MATYKPLDELDWNVEFVDLFQIGEGSCSRSVRAEGVAIIVESIRIFGWEPSSLVIVYRDPAPPADSSIAPRFPCVDGMHCVRAVFDLSQDLKAEDSDVGWPKTWPIAYGQFHMPGAILHAVPSEMDLVSHAWLRNWRTNAIVRMSYLNYM
jgi:hypothetical protein